jgi:hypothetical protein
MPDEEKSQRSKSLESQTSMKQANEILQNFIDAYPKC